MKTYVLRPRPIADAGHAQDAACPDASWKPLTKKQKGLLSMLAAKAYAAQEIHAVTLTEWRHDTAIRACGRRISEATQKHWADLKAEFQDLSGQPVAAFKTQMREGDNKRRIALHKLTQALSAKGLNPSYAASICFCQYKVPLEQATAKQLWCLFYTIQNRKK